MAKQVVRVAVQGAVLTYVWKGDVPLAIGDVVRVRNPRTVEREQVPLVKGTVVDLDSGTYKGYLVVIHDRVDEYTRETS